MCAAVYRYRHLVKATEVTAGLAESNGSLLPGIWRDTLHVTCGLTACTPGSAPGPTLGNEYEKTLPLPLLCQSKSSEEPFQTRDADLAGFWDMVMLQVTDVDRMFAELDELSRHNWNIGRVSIQPRHLFQFYFSVLIKYYYLIFTTSSSTGSSL